MTQRVIGVALLAVMAVCPATHAADEATGPLAERVGPLRSR